MSEAHNSQLEKKLWKLHRQLIEFYLALLKREKGNMLKGSLVDSIRQFLKDNGVYHTAWNQKQNLEQLMIPGDKVSETVGREADSNDNGIVEEYRDEDYFDPEGSSSRNTGAEEDDGEFNIKH